MFPVWVLVIGYLSNYEHELNLYTGFSQFLLEISAKIGPAGTRPYSKVTWSVRLMLC